MDYSSIANDLDSPAGTSPWANTSPRQSRHDLSQPPASIENRTAPPATMESSFLSETSEQQTSMDDASPLPSNVENSVSPENGHFTERHERQQQQQQQQPPHAQHQSSIPYRTQQLPPQQQQQPNAFDPTQPQPYDPRDFQQTHVGQRPQHRPLDGPRPNAQHYKLQAKVNGLERSGRKDPILRFDIYTNLPRFRTTQFRDVRRTHAEFTKLAEHLISANPEAMVPAMPPATTSAGAGTDEDETRMKTVLQRWLNYVCGNEVLMHDEEMIRFVEGDPGYSPVVKWSQPATGVRRKVIKQFAPPPDDTPELQQARPVVKQFYLGSMDAGQKVDKMVKGRRGLGLSESDFGNKMGVMSETELHPGLRNAYRKLGKTIQTIGDLRAAQGTAEAATLADPLQYHSADAFIVKETLTNRHILLRELIQAQQSTRAKLSATDRLKSSTSVRRDKVDEAISALEEARNHEQQLFKKTQGVTANLLQEKRKWFARTSADLRASIREHVIREIEAERRALAVLEAVRPDIRGIDASGGLSRLGREAHPTSRRTALASSQGPKGDAWSGVQRRANGLNRDISSSFTTPGLPVDPDGEEDGVIGAAAIGRDRAASGSSSVHSVQEQDDEDRVDAKNAASRLATSTF